MAAPKGVKITEPRARGTMRKSPRILLANCLRLMYKRIQYFRKLEEEGTFNQDTELIKYAHELMSLVKEADAQQTKRQKTLAGKPTRELKRLAKELVPDLDEDAAPSE